MKNSILIYHTHTFSIDNFLPYLFSLCFYPFSVWLFISKLTSLWHFILKYVNLQLKNGDIILKTMVSLLRRLTIVRLHIFFFFLILELLINKVQDLLKIFLLWLRSWNVWLKVRLIIKLIQQQELTLWKHSIFHTLYLCKCVESSLLNEV